MASPINAALDRLFSEKITDVTRGMAKRATVYAVIATDPVQCPNCIWDTDNNTGSGKYNGTGPKAFETRVCPVCKNAGKLVTDRKIKLVGNVRWGKIAGKGNQVLRAGELAEGTARIKVLKRDRPNVEKAKHFMVDNIKCVREGELRNRGLQTYVITEFVVKRAD